MMMETEAILNVRHLDRIGRLSVMLRTNLADHLLLLREKDAVLIYHHASFLLHQDEFIMRFRIRLICLLMTLQTPFSRLVLWKRP